MDGCDRISVIALLKFENIFIFDEFDRLRIRVAHSFVAVLVPA